MDYKKEVVKGKEYLFVLNAKNQKEAHNMLYEAGYKRVIFVGIDKSMINYFDAKKVMVFTILQRMQSRI